MNDANFPDWVRILLLALSFISFLPQLIVLVRSRESTGISLYYVLSNVISAAHQLSIGCFHLFNSTWETPNNVLHGAPTSVDWLDLAQLACMFLLWLVMFEICAWLPSGDRHLKTLSRASRGLLLFLFISLVPSTMDAISISFRLERYNCEVLALFDIAHMLFLSPVVFLIRIAGIIIQTRKIQVRQGNLASLSLVGMAVQAVVFLLLSIAWPSRLQFDWNTEDGVTLGQVLWWCQWVGSVAIDSVLLTIGQVVLVDMAICLLPNSSSNTDSAIEAGFHNSTKFSEKKVSYRLSVD